MKCLIISDSHGDEQHVKEVINSCLDEVDAVIHCGDSELSSSSPILEKAYVVQGNCDLPGSFAEDRLETVKGVRIYVTHGHHYNVKMSYVPLSYRAEEKEADLVCFGHSHVAAAFQENGVLYINPGSLVQPRGRQEKTYAMVEYRLKGRHAEVHFYKPDGEEVPELHSEIWLSN
ncbi:metallophosphoesterase [Bacillus piscicola]|uniref:metallophosphoesterase n=1 Tax=Bacillus piscicola TaxID=1632684 RepID=UPI001F097771|nr:metallophosphoesterase [Bacillus piscicola]